MLEPGEDSRQAALRELAEELGPAAPRLAPTDLSELGSVRLKSGKLVDGWAAQAEFDPADLDSNPFSIEWPPRSGRQVEFPEVDRVEWFDPETAASKLNQSQAEFVHRLLALLDFPAL